MHHDTEPEFDPDALREKYRIERDKRMRDDGVAQYIEVAVRYFGADERYTVEGSPISGRTEPAARYQPSSTRCTGESCAG